MFVVSAPPLSPAPWTAAEHRQRGRLSLPGPACPTHAHLRGSIKSEHPSASHPAHEAQSDLSNTLTPHQHPQACSPCQAAHKSMHMLDRNSGRHSVNWPRERNPRALHTHHTRRSIGAQGSRWATDRIRRVGQRDLPASVRGGAAYGHTPIIKPVVVIAGSVGHLSHTACDLTPIASSAASYRPSTPATSSGDRPGCTRPLSSTSSCTAH